MRKHCRKHHPQWLAKLDEQVKESRTHNRSELYCYSRLLTAEEAEAIQRDEPRKRPRTVGLTPTDLNRAPSEENVWLDSPASSIAEAPRIFVTPQHLPLESPRGEIMIEKQQQQQQAYAMAMPMTPLRLDDDLPVTPLVCPPPRGQSCGFCHPGDVHCLIHCLKSSSRLALLTLLTLLQLRISTNKDRPLSSTLTPPCRLQSVAHLSARPSFRLNS